MNNKLYQALNNCDHFHSLIDYASKTGFIDIRIDTVEKYNHDHPYEKPKSDGTFDVEGHSSADVISYYYVYPAKKISDLVAYIKNVLSWIKDVWEFKSWTYAKETWPFKTKWSQWMFVVDSFETTKYEIIEDEPQAKKLLKRGDYKSYGQFISASVLGVTDKQIHDRLVSEGYSVASEGIYVSSHDPMCIVFNEKIHKYDLKDGWSDERISELIRLYFSKAGLHFNVRLIG